MIAGRVLDRLAELAQGAPPARYVVAFSGGLDSTVLLHVLASTRPRHGRPLVAVHVHHGLQPAADRFEVHCVQVAGELSVPLETRRVAVPADDPRGIEAAAREQRYRAIAALVRPGDHVLTAHTRDDQAETLLLKLLRGSGPAGLASIAARRPLGEGLLLRPLLDTSRAELEEYAAAHALQWCEDPSNADTGYDRNFLRREILPALRRRWPQAAASLARSAALLADAAELAAALAEQDLAGLGGDPARLGLAALRRLSPARQRNVLRHAVRRLGLPAPPAAPLEQVVRELVPAASDAQPRVRWEGAEVRRYRDRVYLLATPPRGARPEPATLTVAGEAALGPGLGRLALEPCAAGGLSPALAEAGLEIRFREGGETLRPAGRGHTHSLKKLFQEAGVVPWMRRSVPLLFARERLVAVADLWIAEDAWSAPGYAIRWRERPPLF